MTKPTAPDYDGLAEELEAATPIYNRGLDYAPLMIEPSPLRLKAAAAIRELVAERERLRDTLLKATDQIRECRLADGHAARTGEEGRWNRALHALTSSEPEYRAALSGSRKP